MPEQGSAYAAFIDAELKSEYGRRAGLDTRALSLVTSSSAFVALVFAVTVFVTGRDYKFSAGGSRGLLLTLASLVVAAVLGLVANASREYEVSQIGTLQQMVTKHWTDAEVDARNICAGLYVKTISTLRAGNNHKAGQLVVAFVFQMAAVVGLVVTVAWELRQKIT